MAHPTINIQSALYIRISQLAMWPIRSTQYYFVLLIGWDTVHLVAQQLGFLVTFQIGSQKYMYMPQPSNRGTVRDSERIPYSG